MRQLVVEDKPLTAGHLVFYLWLGWGQSPAARMLCSPLQPMPFCFTEPPLKKVCPQNKGQPAARLA
jgi:hypothetical protein